MENHVFFSLITIIQDTLASWFPTHQLPLLSERVLCLRELGQVLLEGK